MANNIETYGNNSINVEKNKKLQEVLGKKETQELLKKNFEKYKRLENKINILDKTQEEILKLKQELSGTPEEKADKLLKEINETQKNQNSGVIETVKQKAEHKIDEVKDKATKTFLEKTGIKAMIDKFTGMFDKISSIFDTVWKKITAGFAGTALGAWLGFKKEGPEEEKNKKVETEKVLSEDSKTDKKKEETKNEKESIESTNNNIDKKGRLYSKTGFNTLRLFSPIGFENGDDPTNLFQKLSKNNISFKKLEKNFLFAKEENKKEINIKGIKNIDSKDLYKTANILFHDSSFTIYETKLTKNNIEKILKNKNINNILTATEIFEIQSNIKKDKFEYRNLNINLISKLVALSFKGIFGAGLLVVKDQISSLFGYLTSETGLLKNIKEEVNERNENLLSKNLWKILKGKDSGFNFGGEKGVYKNKKDLLKDYNKNTDYGDLEIKQLDKFLQFRDNLLKNINKFNLGFGTEFDDSFKTGLNIGKIAVLYTLLDGKNIDHLGSFEKGNVYLWIIEILRKNDGNNDISGKYQAKLAKEASKENSEYLDKNQQKVIKLLTYKILSESEKNFDSKLKHGVDIANEFLKGLLPDSFSNETKENIIETIEYIGLAALIGYLVLGKKNPVLKFSIMTSGIIGYFAIIFAGKGAVEGLKTKLGEENYERFKSELDKLLKEEQPKVTIGGTTTIVNNYNTAEQLANGETPEETNKMKLNGEYIYLGKNGELKNINKNEMLEKSKIEPIFIKNGNGFSVIYNTLKYKFDTQTNIASKFIDDYIPGNIDSFKGYNLNFTDIKITSNEITFGGDNYKLKISDIVNKIKTGKKESDFSGKLSYYVIDSNGNDKLVLSTEN